jgi:hypothetical protein
MALVSVSYSFSPGTVAVSAQVNQNFADLVTAFNTGIAGSTTSGYMQLLGGLFILWGSGSVAADGSAATAVTYGTTLTTATVALVAGISNNYGTNNWAVTHSTSGESTSGFNMWAAGAPGGQSVNFWWIALGY